MDAREEEIGSAGRLQGAEGRGRSVFVRYAARRPGVLIGSIVFGLVLGVAYRFAFDPDAERTLGYFLRSGAHGMGLGLTVWAVQTAGGVGGPLGAALRRLPVAAEVMLRALVMTAAIIVVGVALQALLYGDIERKWITGELPHIVAVVFVFSVVVGVVIELERLIGGPLLVSALVGVYHRPTRRQLVVMFLDIAHSTRLAEAMGEVRVHDLITRFFFDIDGPIADFGGRVHAYVGDEVIVSWALTDDPALNARPIACFAAIERRMAALARNYEAEFGVVPGFRAGVHAGPVVVSECGDAKRQLALFGDTMNVASRLCDYAKTSEARLVISADLRRAMAALDGVSVGEATLVEARGRREPVEAHVVGLAPIPPPVRRPS